MTVSVFSCTLWTLLNVHTIVIATQQLQSQLDKVQHESQDKEKQLSRLKDENDDLHMEMSALKLEYEQQQKELNQNGTCTCNIMQFWWTCIIYYLDVKIKLLEAEKQQWLLHQKISHGKDMQISKLQYSIEQMQGKCKHVKLFTINYNCLSQQLSDHGLWLTSTLVFKQTISP